MTEYAILITYRFSSEPTLENIGKNMFPIQEVKYMLTAFVVLVKLSRKLAGYCVVCELRCVAVSASFIAGDRRDASFGSMTVYVIKRHPRIRHINRIPFFAFPESANDCGAVLFVQCQKKYLQIKKTAEHRYRARSWLVILLITFQTNCYVIFYRLSIKANYC